MPDIVVMDCTRSCVLSTSRVPARQVSCNVCTKSLATDGGIRMTDKSPCSSLAPAETAELTILKAV
ncbi:Uncharacterised protein [Shigella sonnei]|nr:Uncharacterised protein [Shigella sonnei]